MTVELIKQNPSLKKPAMQVLSIAKDQPDLDRGGLEAAAQEVWSESFAHSPSVTVDILERADLLAEVVVIDGEVYDGTLEDVQLDASVPDDADCYTYIEITDAGVDALAEYDPAHTLSVLLEDHPQYEQVFRAALQACAADGGATRADVEAVIQPLITTKEDAEAGNQSVYPQFFIDSLETAGGIVWDGGWKITEAGKALLEA
jgi:hypothetical protein